MALKQFLGKIELFMPDSIMLAERVQTSKELLDKVSVKVQ
jgi:hypothetical protein